MQGTYQVFNLLVPVLWNSRRFQLRQAVGRNSDHIKCATRLRGLTGASLIYSVTVIRGWRNLIILPLAMLAGSYLPIVMKVES